VNAPDPQRLAALARRLDLAPRELLVLAGRIAARPEPLDAARLRREVADVRAAGAFAGNLAMLAYAEYAIDDLQRALELAAWEPPAREG
jgi:hypothetical protein